MSNNDSRPRSTKSEEEIEDAANALLAMRLERQQGEVADARLLIDFATTDAESQSEEAQELQRHQARVHQQLLEEHNQRFAALGTTLSTIAGTALEADVAAMMTALGAGATIVQALIYLENAGWDLDAARAKWEEDVEMREGPAPPPRGGRGRQVQPVEDLFLRNAAHENLSKNESSPLPDWPGLTRAYNSFFDGVFIPGVHAKNEARTHISISTYMNRAHLDQYSKGIPPQTRHKRARATIGKKKHEDWVNFWEKHGGPPDGGGPSGGAGGQGLTA